MNKTITTYMETKGYDTKTKIIKNYFDTVHFNHPEWVPCRLSILPATWLQHREKVEEIVLSHPKLFPDYKKGQKNFNEMTDGLFKEGIITDNWGCTWKNVKDGMIGYCIKSPLENWNDFETYRPPDPLTQSDYHSQPDWTELKKSFEKIKTEKGLAQGGLPHGFMYMRVCYYLRGFENFMMDIAHDEPRLKHLLEMVLEYNLAVIHQYLECGVELMIFGDDLGIQASLPMSPTQWRKYLKPCYSKLFGICQDRGVDVYFHSDGHILEIMDDLIETGISIINPQIRANTLDGIEKIMKGKICIELDLDRQLFPFATPGEIRHHILESFNRLYSKEGGLTLLAEISPDVPLENVNTICDVFEEIGGPGIWNKII